MINIDGRFNIIKDKEDFQMMRLDVFNYIVGSGDTFKLRVKEGDKLIKEYDSYAVQGNSVFFKLDNTVNVGKYKYDILVLNNNGNVVILANRRYEVND